MDRDDERSIDDETPFGDGRHAEPVGGTVGQDRSADAHPENQPDSHAEDHPDDRQGSSRPGGQPGNRSTGSPPADNPPDDSPPDDSPPGGPYVVDADRDPDPAVHGAGSHRRRAIDPPPAEPDSGRGLTLPPGPAPVAVNLGLLTKNGWVFQDINLTLRPASVAAVVGPAGTGRTSLLLALVGRMEANTGSLTVAGHSLQDRPKSIRAVTSVARAGRLTAPEPGLTVAESVSERCLIEDENVLAGRSRFEEACAALHLEVDPTMLVGRLAGEQATLLAVALACVRVSAVIVLDDLDRDVSAATQQRLLDALIRLAGAIGPTIIVSTTDRIPVMEADIVLDLTPMDGAAIWALDPRNAPTELIARQLGADQESPWAAELPAVDAEPGAAPPSGGGVETGADPGAETWGQDGAGSDFDGRWSRGKWEPTADAGAGNDPRRGAPDDVGRGGWGNARPGAPEQPATAGDPDPSSIPSSDRAGDSAPGHTEDPR